MLKKNDLIELEIIGIANDGNGFGRYENIVVFVPMTAPGDIIIAHIVKVLKSYCYGIIDNIVKPSENRNIIDCKAYKHCGGCSLRHINYSSEISIKTQWVKDSFERIGGFQGININECHPSPSIDEYRNKAQFPFGIEKGLVTCGFYAKRSHRIITNDNCMLHPQVFKEIANCVCKWANATGCTVYNEETNKGILRHLFIRKSSVDNSIMVCLVINADSIPRKDILIKELLLVCNSITSIQLNINKKNTNVILGENCEVLYGESNIFDILSGVKIKISPQAFYQVNHDCAEILYKQIELFSNPTKNQTILDLYCGAGTIGLSMARKINKLIGIDIIPEAIENAKNNALMCGITNAEFLCEDAETYSIETLNNKYKIDTIIIDPPRKGCSNKLLDSINEVSPDKIIMVSCNHVTAARDTKYLCSNGYSLLSIELYDMFPRTNHVETVVLMSRVNR